MSAYKLTIRNQTGVSQDYVFFSAPPMVSGGTSGPIYQHVMKAAPSTPNDGMVTLELSNKYYAIAGVYEKDDDSDGQSVSVSKSVPVELGHKASNGSDIVMGSSVTLTVKDKSSVDLGPPTTPGAGKLGCFQLNTAVSGDGFSFQDAKNNGILVGIANSKHTSIMNAMGTFTPYPNTTYQIQPTACLWVASGQRFDVGSVIMAERLSNTQAVDFNVRGTNNVTLIHDEQNRFVFLQ
ncbi:hypothetical protein V8F20_002397 [Naviculisporaceae sp. PSN 640]